MPRMSCHIPPEIMYLVVKCTFTAGGGVACLITSRGTCKTMCESVDRVVLEKLRTITFGVPLYTYDNDIDKIVSSDEQWFAVRCRVLQWIMSACVAFLHQDPGAVCKQLQKMFIYSTISGCFGCNYSGMFKVVQSKIHDRARHTLGAKKEIVNDLTPRIKNAFPALSTENIEALIETGMRLPGQSIAGGNV